MWICAWIDFTDKKRELLIGAGAPVKKSVYSWSNKEHRGNIVIKSGVVKRKQINFFIAVYSAVLLYFMMRKK